MKKFVTILCAILLTLCGVIFAGCADKYEKLSLKFSESKIEIDFGEEEKFYELKIENYFDMEPKFDFHFDSDIIQNTSMKEIAEGVYRLGFTALDSKVPVSNTTTLRITLLNNNSYIDIPVIVVYNLQSISVKNPNMYVLRGKNLQLDSSLFNFEPSNTHQKELEFFIGETKLDNGLFKTNKDTPNIVSITAKNTASSKLVTFNIQVLNSIDLNKIELKDKDILLKPQGSDLPDEIVIVANSSDKYFKELRLLYDVSDNYVYEVCFENKNMQIEENTDSAVIEGEYRFNIQQASNASENTDNLLIKVWHKGFDFYVETLSYKVVVEFMPKEVRLNGATTNLDVSLYNINLDIKPEELFVSINPSKSVFTDISLEYYIGTQKVQYFELSQYLTIKYQGLEIDNNFTLKDLTFPLTYSAKTVPENLQQISIVFSCNSKYTEVLVTNKLNITINQGAESFAVDTKYQNSTIYVQKGETVIFDGFTVNPTGAHIGTINAQPDRTSVGYVEVTQNLEDLNKASVIIKANKVGEAFYTLTLANGMSARIKIIVVAPLDLDLFKVTLSSNTNDKVAQIVYENNGMGSLKSIAVRGVNGKFEIATSLFPFDANMYTLSITSKDNTIVEKNSDTVFTTKALSANGTVIEVYLQTKQIEDFAMVTSKEAYYNFTVYCFTPLNSFELTAKNNSEKDSYSKFVDVYQLTQVGYTDRLLSEVSLKEEFNPTNSNFTFNDITWKFSVNTEMIGGIYINEYGRFDPKTKIFVCDPTLAGDLVAGRTFQITAVINEFGKMFVSSVNITISKYTEVERVYLYNYTENIYLDSVYNEVTLYPYIMPSTATNKNFAVMFKADSGVNPSVVQIESSLDKIVLRYMGNGSGTGTLQIIPVSKFTDENNNFTYSLNIPITVADGTINAPLHIKTFEEFKKINTQNGLSKHYVIDGIIDAANQSISTMGVLRGSLSGVINGKNVGGIVNFRINSPYGKNVGLFSEIAQGAFVHNLKLQGSIDINNSNAKNVGLLCGVNYGTIKNISVTLINSSLRSYLDGDNEVVNVGGVCGINYAEIFTDLTNENANIVPDETLMVFMPNGQVFNIYTNNSAKIGGVVGYNVASLYMKTKDMVRYNYYGVSAKVQIKYNSPENIGGESKLGGLVGYNEGNIADLTVLGEIIGLNNVGGLVGYMAGGRLISCVSRTFIRGSNYIGGLIGNYGGGTVENNTVQAADDGIRLGKEASLIFVTKLITGSSQINELYNITGSDAKQTSGNAAYTYYTREVVDVTGDVSATDAYYGDMIYVENSTLYKLNSFTAAETNKISDNISKNEVLLMFYRALNENEQIMLNDKNKVLLPSEIWNNTTNIPEVTIQTQNSTIISVLNNGTLNLLSSGVAKLKLINSLNARDNFDITIYVTNFSDKLTFYATADKAVELFGEITVTNRNTVSVYPIFEANNVASSGSTLVRLADNNELKFNFSSTTHIQVSTSFKTVNLSGKKDNSGEFIGAGSDSILFTAFYQNAETGFMQDLTYLENTLQTKFSMGIYELYTDKSNITAVPSDILYINVSYKSDSQTDNILLSIKDESAGLTISQTAVNDFSVFEDYFSISATKDIVNQSIVYKIIMNREQIRKGAFYFSFVASESKLTKQVKVAFLDQPIIDVMVKNYSYISNNDISHYDPVLGQTIYNTSFAMLETNEVTAGEVNILRLFITPEYANYSYVEITNAESNYNSNAVAQFSLLTAFGENNYEAIVSSQGYFSVHGIRILKQFIKGGDLQVLYKIPTNVIEGESLKLIIKFYDEHGNLAYEILEKYLVIKMNKSVNVSISGKTGEIDPVTGDVFYRVARGYEYLLDVKTIGYKEDQVVIEINSNVAELVQKNNNYYLKISNDITYGSDLTQEGIKVTLRAYGKEIIDGIVVTSKPLNVICTVVEYVIDKLAINEMFKNTTVAINVGNNADIRKLIVNNLKIEHSQDAASAVEKLKTDLINNASWWIKAEGDTLFKKLLDVKGDNKIDTDDFIIDDGYVTPLNISPKVNYLFGLSATLTYERGYIKVEEQKPINESGDEEQYDQSQIVNFNLVISQNTSEKSPWPIKTYEDMLKMTDGGYYRLMSDIVIPVDFVPLKCKVNMFDGNGYNIKFQNFYSYENTEKFGLFEEIGENCTIKNTTILIANTTHIDFSNSSSSISLVFGLIAATNFGNITNCKINYENTAILEVTNNTTLVGMGNSLIAGVCGINNGFITNTGVEIKIKANGANLSGFVGMNTNHISNCYVKSSSIVNGSTHPNNTTAGFVLKNESQIFGCYVAGKQNPLTITKIYCDDTAFKLSATSLVGGFAYENIGFITDSYSNIPIISSSKNAGFVTINSNTIERCFTLSILGNSDTENYPFVVTNNNSVFKDCFFLRDVEFGLNSNTSLTNNNITGIKSLKVVQFNDNDYFANYTINNNSSSSGTWFYPFNETLDESVKNKNYSYLSVQPEYIYKGKTQSFVARKPELVSANLLAYSKYDIIDSETKVDPDTGETIYAYKISDKYATEGSINNPFLIDSAVKFEEAIKLGAVGGINTNYYRIICDIDYEKDGLYSSNLFNITFGGYLEGNNTQISSFTINNSDAMLNGGLFAQVGGGVTYAVVQNIKLAPNYINLPNAYNVGVLAGTLNMAYVYNVDVDGHAINKNGLVIIGKNIVGGIVGRTSSVFDMQNISSSVSVNATYTVPGKNWQISDIIQNNIYNESVGNFTQVAYSGAIVGYAGGSGNISRVIINGDVACIGMVSGLYFGGIGSQVTVNITDVEVVYTANNYIRASAFGGIIAGHNSGTLNISNIKDGINDKNLSIFKTTPKVPFAVGGVVGFMNYGEINAKQDTTVDVNLNYETIQTVGGIVGYLKAGSINGCAYVNNITASNVVGGIVGICNIIVKNQTKNIVNITDCFVGDKETTSELRIQKNADTTLNDVYLGGYIGVMEYISVDKPSKFVNIKQTDKTTSYTDKISNFKLSASVTVNGLISSNSSFINLGGIVGGSNDVSLVNYKKDGAELMVFEDIKMNSVKMDVDYTNISNLGTHIGMTIYASGSTYGSENTYAYKINVGNVIKEYKEDADSKSIIINSKLEITELESLIQEQKNKE